MTEGGQLASPLACFIAGALVPITYFYLTKSSNADGGGIPLGDDDDWDDSDDDDVQPTSGGNISSSSWGLKDAPYKMVLCVNQELGMGKGKIAAQVGHAAVGCYKRAKRQCPSALSAWERTGCAKIAVKCPTEEEMEVIYAKALSKGFEQRLATVLSGGRWQDTNSSWLTHCFRIRTSASTRVRRNNISFEIDVEELQCKHTFKELPHSSYHMKQVANPS